MRHFCADEFVQNRTEMTTHYQATVFRGKRQREVGGARPACERVGINRGMENMAICAFACSKRTGGFKAWVVNACDGVEKPMAEPGNSEHVEGAANEGVPTFIFASAASISSFISQ